MSHEHEKNVLARKTEQLGVAGVAAELVIATAHVSNVVSTEQRNVGPTLRRAMIAAGWLEQPEPYQYFKINRDPLRAAFQIANRVARGDLSVEWLNDFVLELFDLALVDDDQPIPHLDGPNAVARDRERIRVDVGLDIDAIERLAGVAKRRPGIAADPIVHMGQPVKPKRRPGFGLVGNAEPVIIPAEENAQNYFAPYDDEPDDDE